MDEYKKKVGRKGFLILNTSSSFCLSTGGQWCGCSSYSSLLYAVASAVGVLLLLLLVGFVVMYKVSGFFERSVSL